MNSHSWILALAGAAALTGCQNDRGALEPIAEQGAVEARASDPAPGDAKDTVQEVQANANEELRLLEARLDTVKAKLADRSRRRELEAGAREIEQQLQLADHAINDSARWADLAPDNLEEEVDRAVAQVRQSIDELEAKLDG